MRKIILTTILALCAGMALFVVDAQQQPPAGKAVPKGGVQGRLTWFDRQGKVAGTSGQPGMYRTLAISPDGTQIACELSDPETQNRDIWLIEIASGKTTRFT